MNESLIAALKQHLALPEKISIYDMNLAYGAVTLVIKHLGSDADAQQCLREVIGATHDIAVWALNSDSEEAIEGLRDGVFLAAGLIENEQLPLAA